MTEATQETQGKTEKQMNNTQLAIPQREPTPTNHNIITNHYRTGSIISSRGVTMIKDVKLKLVRKSPSEVAEAVKKEEED